MTAAHRTVCALVSGGVDSCVLLGRLARHFQQVQPLYVRLGLRWQREELRGLRAFLRAARLPHVTPLAVLDLPVRDLYRRHWSVTGRNVPDGASAPGAVYLPGRNLLLLSKAAVHCAEHGIPAIALGSLRHNPFADATPAFLRSFAEAVRHGLQFRLRVIVPYGAVDKATILRHAGNLPVHLTFSCLAPRRGRHCGRCNKCAERRAGFRAAGLADRTVYAA